MSDLGTGSNRFGPRATNVEAQLKCMDEGHNIILYIQASLIYSD
jgi:hypothetical protein